MAVVTGQGKTAFAREVLEKNNQANVKDVNEAWKEAGKDGSISDTLVNNVRSELKLTGNIRPGRRPAGASGAPPRAAAASKSKAGAAAKSLARVPPGKANGKPATKVTLPGAKPRRVQADRVVLFQEMEGELDDLIFKSLAAGGFPEFEETLRKARRILARSHGE